MIKTTIQNSPYCTEITFPCTETELSKKLGELGMNPEHLAPIDTDDLERIGRIHMLNIRGSLSESEYKNSEWLAAEGQKLLDSGKGIDTEYGKLFINEDIPFEENFNGTTLPPYLYNGSPVTVDISYMGLTEIVELPCEDLSIKKAVCRLGADSVKDCKIEISTFTDLSDDLRDKVMAIEKNKDIFGLNDLLKTVDFSVKQEKPESIFKQEIARKLNEEGYTIVMKIGCHPMKTRLKLFFKWDIQFENAYSIEEKSERKVQYADSREVERNNVQKYPPKPVPIEFTGDMTGEFSERKRLPKTRAK